MNDVLLLDVLDVVDVETILKITVKAVKAGYEYIEVGETELTFINRKTGRHIVISKIDGTCYGYGGAA